MENQTDQKSPSARRSYRIALFSLAWMIGVAFLFPLFLVFTDFDILWLVMITNLVLIAIATTGASMGFKTLFSRPKDPPEKVETVFSAYFFNGILALFSIGCISFLIYKIISTFIFGPSLPEIEITPVTMNCLLRSP